MSDITSWAGSWPLKATGIHRSGIVSSPPSATTRPTASTWAASPPTAPSILPRY